MSWVPGWRLILGPEPSAVRSRAGRRRPAGDVPASALAVWSGRGLGGAENMAIDRALFAGVQAGGAPVLRLYTWDPPCISFGRNQRVRGVYDLDAAAARGFDVVRRPTGGLAVLHDRELTYSVCVPAGVLGSPRETYRAIHALLVAALRAIGVDAALADGAWSARAARAASPSPVQDSALPCFDAPTGGEVVAGGRKLVGSAQRCERRVILQHGSILLGGSQAPVRELLSPRARPLANRRGAPPGAGWTSLERLGRPASVTSLAAAIVAVWRSWSGAAAPAT